ncbi:MAG: GGDEF domain-containing protein [Clostridia bacterium]|nr:GGDEF domain-containing protein [Clostridia bacterium]
MDNHDSRGKNRTRGIPTWKVVLPVTIVLFVLHAIIISTNFIISNASNGMTKIMRTYSEYIADVNKIPAGSSYLSETSFSFILRPTLKNGETNIEPLGAFAGELKNPRRGGDVKALFENRDVSDETRQKIDLAATHANALLEIQLHAIALTLPDKSLAEAEELGLPLPELTEEELLMDENEKAEKAFDLISGVDYSVHKKLLSENATAAATALQQQMKTLQDEQLGKVSTIRTLLWTITLAVIAVLLFVFVLLITLLILPLGKFAKGIDAGTSIPEKNGLAEVQLVAHSYNELLEKKNTLEDALRSAAETDWLTGLPNRYCMEQYLLQKFEDGIPVAFFLFDVNFLKLTNDKEGHLAGDALLQKVAKCISSCFDGHESAKCFRYGGDEFVAIVKNCDEAEIEKILLRFEEEQQAAGVSVSTGHSYTADMSRTTIKELFAAADKEMYANKKHTHEQQLV